MSSSGCCSPSDLEEYEVVGLSGTSGGAVCATLAWAALVEGDPARAGRLLEGFWTDNSATGAARAAAERLGAVGERG